MKVGTYECPICHAASSPDDGLAPAYPAPFEKDPVRALFVTPSLHWNCFYSWEGRVAFARASFQHEVARYSSSPLHGMAFVDDNVAVFVAVAEPMLLTIVNAQTGRSFVLSQQQWLAWQTGDYSSDQSLHSNELRFVVNALRPVWKRFPDKLSFTLHTDWAGSERHLYADL